MGVPCIVVRVPFRHFLNNIFRREVFDVAFTVANDTEKITDGTPPVDSILRIVPSLRPPLCHRHELESLPNYT